MISVLVLVRTILLTVCDAYVAAILIYVLMSWLPNKDYGWVGDIYRFLGRICDPFLNLFKRIIPPIGGMIDISPIFAIIVVQLVGRLVAWLL
jgi:YggT family protein